jgi:hypothetical protein
MSVKFKPVIFNKLILSFSSIKDEKSVLHKGTTGLTSTIFTFFSAVLKWSVQPTSCVKVVVNRLH